MLELSANLYVSCVGQIVIKGQGYYVRNFNVFLGEFEISSALSRRELADLEERYILAGLDEGVRVIEETA